MVSIYSILIILVFFLVSCSSYFHHFSSIKNRFCRISLHLLNTTNQSVNLSNIHNTNTNTMIEAATIIEKANDQQQNTNAIDTTTESVHLKLTQQYGDTKEIDDEDRLNKNNNTQIKILSYINKTTKDTIIATIDSIGWSALEHFSIHKFSQNLSTSVDIELIEVCLMSSLYCYCYYFY